VDAEWANRARDGQDEDIRHCVEATARGQRRGDRRRDARHAGDVRDHLRGSPCGRASLARAAASKRRLASIVPPVQATGIPAPELEARRDRLLEHVRAHGLTGYVLFDQSYIQYLTGFSFLSNERPIVFAQSAGGEMAVFVPEFDATGVRSRRLRLRLCRNNGDLTPVALNPCREPASPSPLALRSLHGWPCP